MKTKKPEEKIYLAKLKNWNPKYKKYFIKELECEMDEKNIYFIGSIIAWHCRSLAKTDYRILEIKEKSCE